MKRRTIFKLLLFLLAGAIINVAVAWGCALADASDAEVQLHFKTGNDMRLWHDLTSDQQQLIRRGGIKFTRTEIMRIWSGAFSKFGLYQQTHVPFIRHAQTNIQARTTNVRAVVELWFGWPCHAFEDQQIHRFPGRGEVEHAAAIAMPHIRGVFAAGKGHTVPTRPIWPGFAINTIFYAAILYALFAVPAAVRRRFRIKRGVCVRCAYPVGSSGVCSECGAPTDSRRFKPTTDNSPS